MTRVNLYKLIKSCISLAELMDAEYEMSKYFTFECGKYQHETREIMYKALTNTKQNLTMIF